MFSRDCTVAVGGLAVMVLQNLHHCTSDVVQWFLVPFFKALRSPFFYLLHRDQSLLDCDLSSSQGEINGTQTGCETLRKRLSSSGCSISSSV